MGWNIFMPRRIVHHDAVTPDGEPAGANGFGAPIQITYGSRRNPPGLSENAGLYPYETYLSPRWTPIGGGIPNKRDIGTAPPAYSRQGVLVAQVGSPGILSGAFVSGSLTNTTTTESNQPIPITGSFALPQL